MKVLAIGAHYDDIEIGCGGSLIKHIDAGNEIFFGITSSDEYRTGDIMVRYKEQIASAEILGIEGFMIHRFSYHDEAHDIIGMLDEIQPDTIFTHHEFDTHQDHRRASIIGQAVGRSRTTTTLFYDSGSSYNFNPNVFSMIEYEKKCKLMECFKSQIEFGAVNIDIIKKKNEHWATLLTEKPLTYAEGFMSRKMIYEV